ncbi:hypothetical protein H5410_001265 [Solanum commersonii]|uniref:Uncharacterized protein n=1 Tax=Solanum commersonii TaxID=4109 RepID=A0A9J6AYM7_SOLCO|nr:hypothetical protein H5410_001265 [Solanum commersonii]
MKNKKALLLTNVISFFLKLFSTDELFKPRINIFWESYFFPRNNNFLFLILINLYEFVFKCRTFVCPYLKGVNLHGCGLCYDFGDDEYKCNNNTLFKVFMGVQVGIRVNDGNQNFIGEYQWFDLTSLKGCIGLYCGNDMYGDITFELDVWIMEQDAWMDSVNEN